MSELVGKKLLILGGNPETGFLVQEANRLGVHTIVVDPNPQAPAKAFASERHDIDGFDVPTIVELARSREVNGILVGVADILVEPYFRVAEQMGFPCYANEAAVQAFGSKEGFKNLCLASSLNDIPGDLVSGRDLEKALKIRSLPILMKPVNSGGGVGIRTFMTDEDIDIFIPEIAGIPQEARFLIEPFMDCDDIFAYYTFVDGRVFLSAIADRLRIRDRHGRSPVCLAARYPSRYTELFVNSVHPQLEKIFQEIGVENGVLSIQFFVQGGRFYAYDPGFRLQGEAPHVHLKEINDFDQRHMLISFALTGSMGMDDFESHNDFRFRGRKAATLWILLGPGRIAGISGLDDIKHDPSVSTVIQRLGVGDIVDASMLGTERQVLARVYVSGASYEDLASKSELFRDLLSVQDECGNEMIVDWVSPQALVGEEV